MKNFIFGYGSLICPQSRATTAPSLINATAEPVVVNHIERAWSARVFYRKRAHSSSKSKNMTPSSVLGMTPVGVRFRRGAVCNGVLICVDDEELFRFDERELGYSRCRIDIADIHRHIDSELLINESMSLWPQIDSSTDQGGYEKSLSREKIGIGEVACSECRLVFEQGSAKRMKTTGAVTSSAATVASSHECEEIAVWVYVQNEK